MSYSSYRSDWSVHINSSQLQLGSSLVRRTPTIIRVAQLVVVFVTRSKPRRVSGGSAPVRLRTCSLLHTSLLLPWAFSCAFFPDCVLIMYIFFKSQFMLHKSLMASSLEAWHKFSGKWFWTCFNPGSGKHLSILCLLPLVFINMHGSVVFFQEMCMGFFPNKIWNVLFARMYLHSEAFCAV